MVRFTMTVVRDIEVDLSDYQHMGSKENPEEPLKTIEEASEFNMQCDIQDPFAFIDDKDTKIEMKYEILPEYLKHRI